MPRSPGRGGWGAGERGGDAGGATGRGAGADHRQGSGPSCTPEALRWLLGPQPSGLTVLTAFCQDYCILAPFL